MTFIRIMSGRERYNQVLLNNPNNTRFVNRLKTRLIPLFINAFNLSFDNKKAIYIFEFYIPGIISVISQWMKNNRDVSIEELAEVVEGILKNGVLAQLEA
ncbi:MAG: TetR family transcriptional regulator C-terminal domain-containing protein [Agathobacter sp.]|nr:TetR family transcriptional regulator C-terminal domain-containing protein [Agathobacter sp.]